MLPVFSAAHTSQYEQLTQQPEKGFSKSNPLQWSEVKQEELDKNLWDYYLDMTRLRDPSIPKPHATPSKPSAGVKYEDDVDKHVTTFPDTGNRTSDQAPTQKYGLSGCGLLSPSTMTNKTRAHTWISLWFLISIPIVFWDVGYCLLRPRSMKGGDLHWIFKPYGLYQEIDYVYGVKALEENNGFTSAQALLNIFENLLNIFYLYLTHLTDSRLAILVGFTSAVMTLSKTVLYWAQEHFCGYCAVGHNTLRDLIFLWALPGLPWIIFPALIIKRLGMDIGAHLCAERPQSPKPDAVEKRKL